MTKEKRNSPRYAVRNEVHAELLDANGKPQSGRPIDISLTGAYISDSKVDLSSTEVVFWVNDKKLGNGGASVSAKCRVLPDRTGPNGTGFAVKFVESLTPADFSMLCDPAHSAGSVDLARIDVNTVNNEMVLIRNCRSQIFLSTLGAVAVWIMSAIGLGIANQLHPSIWLTLGAAFPYAALTVGILSMMEKANAINLRKGYLAAVSDYLRFDLAPPGYLGWSHLSVNRISCGSRQKNALCRAAASPCTQYEDSDLGHITKGHPVLNSPLENFGTLIGIVFAPIYVGSGLVLFMVWFSFFTSAVAFAVGLVVPLLGFFLYFQIHSLRKGKRCAESYYLQWRTALRYCNPIHSTKSLRESNRRRHSSYPPTPKKGAFDQVDSPFHSIEAAASDLKAN